MGAMTYVNRIRKKIVERANTMLVKSWDAEDMFQK
jgi:hypothetical protein